MDNISTRPLRIAIDLDDVLAALVPAWLGKYNSMFDDALKVEDITDWRIAEFTKKCLPHQFHDLLTPDLYATVAPHTKAFETIQMAAEFARVYIVSTLGPYRGIAQAKIDWIEDNLPHGKIEDVAFMRDKDRFDCDYLIDDAPHNLAARIRDKSGIMIRRPWNLYSHHGFPTFDSAFEAMIHLSMVARAVGRSSRWAR